MGLKNSLCTQAKCQLERCWIKAHKRVRVDLVDFGPPDRDQVHVGNLEPSIALVKSDGYDLISHSANDKVTCGCLRTLR